MPNSAWSLDEGIIVALRRISQAIDTHSRFLWQEHGITAPQLGALRVLQRHGPMTPGDLAAALHISPATIAGITQRLQQHGLITRQRQTSDRRSVLLSVSEQGTKVARQAPSLLRDRFRKELDQLKEWERTQILSVLQRVADMIGVPDTVEEQPFFYHEPSPAAAGTAVSAVQPVMPTTTSAPVSN
ncbi:MAG: MarR family transcriptional regulator [Pirellulales bacterium]